MLKEECPADLRDGRKCPHHLMGMPVQTDPTHSLDGPELAQHAIRDRPRRRDARAAIELADHLRATLTVLILEDRIRPTKAVRPYAGTVAVHPKLGEDMADEDRMSRI